MPSFWSYIGNDKYNIGCTGQTVYVYDKAGNELAKFKDLKYAYTAMISPCGDIFVVKSTAGSLAVYSLETMSLIKKFRFSKVDASQDDNFCFSPDGTEFFNLERHVNSLQTAISVYDTKDFSLKRRILNDDNSLVLSSIEYDFKTNEYYLLGFFRKNRAFENECFVGKLIDNELKNIVYISRDEHFFCVAFLAIKLSGFAQKKYDWSYVGASLEELKNSNFSLANLWNKYYK